MRHNNLEFSISRWSLAPPTYENQFLDFVSFPDWDSEKVDWPLNSSRDGGKTWKTENFKMIFGAYFFLSEDKVEQF